MQTYIPPPPSANELVQSQPDLCDAKELASRLKVPISWVREQSRSRAADPIPHIKLGRYVRYERNSPAFKTWLERRRKGSK